MKITALADVVVNDEGTIVQFTRVTPEAWSWFEENCEWEDWQVTGPTLNVDHRPAQQLVDALQADGLTVVPSRSPFMAGRA